MVNTKILIVDDEESVRAMLGLILCKEGYEVSEADDGVKGLEIAERDRPDVIIMDIRMPKMDGMTAFRAIKQRQLSAVVILMTAFGTVDAAVEAMKAGAYDYIIKPFNIEEVKILIRRAVEAKRLTAEANLLRKEISSYYRTDGTLTNSSRMRQVYETVARVAPAQTTVLITGESGTGKEVLVNTIHYNSQRANGPLIKVNCSALPEALLESELFGHEKGAFTSAAVRRLGRFELADKGTLFLDEIGEMPLAVQVKLLRVLQEREFERVGSCQTVKTDIRIIAATNRSLPEMVAKGEFREDLYYRLAVVTLEIPPLRKRQEDIAFLGRLFLQKFAREANRDIDDFDREAIALLEQHHWPGNIRELSNVVERAVIMGTGRLIFAEDLPPYLLPLQCAAALPENPPYWQGRSLKDIIKEAEKNIIRKVLARNHGNRMKTARDLAISRRALQYKIEEYSLAGANEES
ncbi:sigma 54-interacting transcriptional regulator [Anaerospora sp.]|uniref:sigma 54-interacting transcriptional regulator n=1 Tax=Anaerospora sp. TaxID=1960278 RepID=UPI00289DECC1|nr:sigma 54-interacting transcriptional regulator [Anaerospora sp.]